MEELLQHKRIKLKKDKFAPPHTFLGSQLQLKALSGCEMWTQSSAKYIDAAIKTIEQALLTRKIFIPTKVTATVEPIEARSSRRYLRESRIVLIL